MPELPEVETTRLGIAPHVESRVITGVVVRNPNLRWPVPDALPALIINRTVDHVSRRGKYLLLGLDNGQIIIHLGMSGSLRILPAHAPPQKHDHVDIVFDNGLALRLRDPRRFGCVLWRSKDEPPHPLLARLGPEPLSPDFSGHHLWLASRKRSAAVKNLIMDSHIVVGVGNIYACESLHMAGIHPKRAAGNISLQRYEKLAAAIKQVLTIAIDSGGTTLRDFTQSDGKPGYFQQSLAVYGREGEACPRCGKAIRNIRLGQRSTFFCCGCQH